MRRKAQMQSLDVASTIAEIAVGLAGFSGLALVLGRRQDRLTSVEKYRLILLLTPSLLALFLAVAPLALLETGIRPPVLWRAASGVQALICVGLVVGFAPWTGRVMREAPEIFHWPQFTLVAGGYVVNGLLQGLHAAGFFGSQNAGIYLVGLVFLLLHAGHQFVRILLVRPSPRIPSRS
ncbi:MAG: hypothetical protein P8Y07_11385 [Gemmatimonadales bacterium]